MYRIALYTPAFIGLLNSYTSLIIFLIVYALVIDFYWSDQSAYRLLKNDHHLFSTKFLKVMASQPKQRKIDNFFAADTSKSRPTASLVINDVDLPSVAKPPKAHVTVNESTLTVWKKSFPWLTVIENETELSDGSSLNEVCLKCSLCIKYGQGNVWAKEGALNIQKSALDR